MRRLGSIALLQVQQGAVQTQVGPGATGREPGREIVQVTGQLTVDFIGHRFPPD